MGNAFTDYLGRFPDFERGAKPGTEPFRLDRMRWLLTTLGHPERAYRIVHVGGTKGKGSTATMVSAILGAAGLHVGLYTSPHLRDFRERIAIDGRPARDETIMRLVRSVIEPAVAQLPLPLGTPTAFEITTLVALIAFVDAGVQVAVVEVGLGGTLDATNAIERSDVVVLTPISLDHTHILGNTVELIARDKAGIIKPGSIVVMAPQPVDAAEQIVRSAERAGSRLLRVGLDARVERLEVARRHQRIRLQLSTTTIAATLPLAGEHQAINAATAALAVEQLLADEQDASGPKRLAEAIQAGLERVGVPGRFQYVGTLPNVVVDVAHNDASARALSATVAETLRPPVVYVVGMSGDKDAQAFLAALASTAAAYILVKSTHPRAMDTERLAEAARTTGVPTVTAGSMETGLGQALARGWPERAVLITGSFYTVAEALDVLEGAPAPT